MVECLKKINHRNIFTFKEVIKKNKEKIKNLKKKKKKI
jgi:hypothetical protein